MWTESTQNTTNLLNPWLLAIKKVYKLYIRVDLFIFWNDLDMDLMTHSSQYSRDFYQFV